MSSRDETFTVTETLSNGFRENFSVLSGYTYRTSPFSAVNAANTQALPSAPFGRDGINVRLHSPLPGYSSSAGSRRRCTMSL